MKPYLRTLTLALGLTFFTACKTGFQLADESENDTIYRGPSENASWRLVLSDDGESFRLQKRDNPRIETSQYALSGDYATLDTGFTEFVVNSGSASELSTNRLPAIKVGDDSFVFFPFTDNQSELIALIPTETTCPSTDVRANALFLDRDSDTSDAANFWLSSFRYDVSQNQAQFSDATALDNAFSLLGDQDFNGGTCLEGAAEDDAGDHYLSTRSSIIEIKDFFADDSYARAFATRSRIINDILDFDSESYVGFLHYQGQPEESYYVSASCDNGICILFREEDYDELDKNNTTYEIEFDQSNLNYQSINGAAVGTVTSGNLTSNAACTLNSNVGSTGTKFIMCNAQAPDDTSSLITLVLVDG